MSGAVSETAPRGVHVAESYDVFLSYNHHEKVAVSRVAKELSRHNVRVWFDEESIVGGDSITQKINEGLAQSRVYAVCLGPDGFGNWHSQEIGAAIMRRNENGQRLIPVLLPGVSKLVDAPPLLAPLKPVSIEREPAFTESVQRLAALIMSSSPAPAPRETDDDDRTPNRKGPKKSEDPVGEIIEQLFGIVRGSGTLTFFLGAGSSEPNPRFPPPPYEIAQQLLSDLHFIGPKYSELIPPLDAASTYFEANSDTEVLERRVMDLITHRSKCEPMIHQHLASIVAELGRIRAEVYRRRPSGRPQLIVTTSIDLMCERALLRRGLSFTRVVQHRSGKQVTKNEYRNVELVGNALRIGDRGGKTFTVSRDDPELLDDAIGRSGFELVQNVGENVNQIRGLDLSDSSDLVLYKYHGSYDVEASCALSTEHYLRLAESPYVPDQIKAIIGDSPTLFLLCGILDADVRHAYHTLLRTAYEQGARPPKKRVAVVRPPEDEEADSYRRMEKQMWAQAKDTLRDRTGIKVVEGEGAQFLNRLLRRFEEVSSTKA